MFIKSINMLQLIFHYFNGCSSVLESKKFFCSKSNYGRQANRNRTTIFNLENCLGLLLLLFLSPAVAQNQSTFVHIKSSATVTAFDNIYIKETKNEVAPESPPVIYVQKGTLIVMHETINAQLIVIENNRAKNKVASQASNQLVNQAEERILKPNVTLFALPFGSRGNNNAYTINNCEAVFTTSPLKEQNKCSTQVATMLFTSAAYILQKKLVTSFFHIQLSPKEKFNRFFSLPPPQNVV